MDKRKINFLCLAYILVWSFVPIFAEITSSLLFKLVFGAVTFVWIGTGFQGLSTFSSNLTKSYFWCSLLFIIIMVLYGIAEYGDINVFDPINYILLFGFCVNCHYYALDHDDKRDNRIVVLCLFALMITLLSTIAGLQINPTASRMLTSSSTDEQASHMLRMQNIGSFDFIYSLNILIPLFLYQSLGDGHKLSKRLLYIALLTASVYCVIISYFTTAAVILFISVVFALLTLKRNMSPGKIIIAGLISMMVIPFLMSIFLSFMLSVHDSIYAQGKLDGLLSYVNGGGLNSLDDDANSRGNLIKRSIGSFISNPIWGVGGYYRIGEHSPIGHHSQFIDELARYGVIGAILLFRPIKKCFKSVLKTRKACYVYSSPAFVSLLIFIILGFLNPVFNYCIMSTVFVLVPTISRKIITYENTVYN